MNAFFDFLRTPPAWCLAILLVWMVSEILTKALRLATGGLIAVMESFLIVIFAALILHVAFEGTIRGTASDNNVFSFVIALMVFALLSMIVYIIEKKLSSK
jgi:hypothetical protein